MTNIIMANDIFKVEPMKTPELPIFYINFYSDKWNSNKDVVITKGFSGKTADDLKVYIINESKRKKIKIDVKEKEKYFTYLEHKIPFNSDIKNIRTKFLNGMLMIYIPVEIEEITIEVK